MALGIGFGAERCGSLALRFPRAAIVCLLGLLVLIGISLPRLSFDDDIHRVFLSDSAESMAQRAFDAAQDPPLTNVLIYFGKSDAFTTTDLQALRDFSLDLEFLDGVHAVASPFVLRFAPEPNAPSGKPLFATEISTDFQDDLARFRALETGLPTFVNDNATALLMQVSVDVTVTGLAAMQDAIQSELTRALPDGVSAKMTGEDVISGEIVTGLKDDLIALNLWGALIVAVAAFVFLRDLRMALLVVLPAVFGAAAVLGLSVWLGYPITVLSNVIPILLLVLGVADGVHLAGHLKTNGSVLSAVQTVGPACALTALTTSVAFASIMLTGNVQLFEFAVLGALGTLLSFVIVLVSFAMLAQALTPSQRPVPAMSATVSGSLARIGADYPRATTIGCALLLALGVLGFSQTKAWFPLYQNLPDGSATIATNDAIAQDFGGVFQMIVETSGNWEETRALVTALEQTAGPGTVLSHVQIARWLGTPETAPTTEDLKPLPPAVVDALGHPDGLQRIFVSMPEPMRNAQALENFDRIHDAAQKGGADAVFGLPTIMRQEAVRLIDQLSFGLSVAAIGATLLVAVAFRSVRLIPVLIMPNLLPLMVTGASLHLWAQSQLSPTAVLALTIAFGIAIDDTVHFLNRYWIARKSGAAKTLAVAQAARSAGQVMVLTTVLLTCGLCVTLFSAFTPIRLFGGMMIVTLWAALLIDLLLLPALLTWKGSVPDAV